MSYNGRPIVMFPGYYCDLSLSLEEVVVLSVLSELDSWSDYAPITEEGIIRNLGGRFTIEKVNKMLTKLEKKGFIKRGVSGISFPPVQMREVHANG